MRSRSTRKAAPPPSPSSGASRSNGTGRWSKSSAVAPLLLLAFASPATTDESEALWRLLQSGGQVVVMRHATTEPGVGDPPGVRLDDCATQRNLSEPGREEARRIGAAFRAGGVPIGRVLSSRWCRCLETARLAFGTVEPWPPLDSFFNDRSREPEQTQAVRRLVSERPTSSNLILVTHQVNISALTGLYPAPGEMIVLTPQGDGSFRVAGRLPPGQVSSP